MGREKDEGQSEKDEGQNQNEAQNQNEDRSRSSKPCAHKFRSFFIKTFSKYKMLYVFCFIALCAMLVTGGILMGMQMNRLSAGSAGSTGSTGSTAGQQPGKLAPLDWQEAATTGIDLDYIKGYGNDFSTVQQVPFHYHCFSNIALEAGALHQDIPFWNDATNKYDIIVQMYVNPEPMSDEDIKGIKNIETRNLLANTMTVTNAQADVQADVQATGDAQAIGSASREEQATGSASGEEQATGSASGEEQATGSASGEEQANVQAIEEDKASTLLFISGKIAPGKMVKSIDLITTLEPGVYRGKVVSFPTDSNKNVYGSLTVSVLYFVGDLLVSQVRPVAIP